MGKRKRRKTRNGKRKGRGPRRSSGNQNFGKMTGPLLALTCGVALLGIGYYWLSQSQPSPNATASVVNDAQAKTDLREKRPTQSPAMYAGSAGNAYAIAKAIPAVLDRLYCYCRCRETFGHKNLLTCYVDNHAAT